MSEILVVVEHRKQKLAEISLEMLTKGAQLADQSGSELVAVVIGKNIHAYAAEIADWADRVLAVQHSRLDGSLAEPYQKILSLIIKERQPRLTLIGHSSFAMDLAPALAVEVGVPLVTDCIDISLENETVVIRRSIYNDRLNAVYSFAPSEAVMLTGRTGQFPIKEMRRGGDIEEIQAPIDEFIDYKRFEGYIEPEESEVDITRADVLVSVGRGIKSDTNLVMAEELADMLGGVVSCSRPVTDQGWLPLDRQVGLSGKTVKPKLYLALGMSGAYQHMVGAQGSETIVAINSDPGAPIFANADYGIVNDLFKVVPALVRIISQLKDHS